MAMIPGATFRTIDEPKPGPKMAAIFAERAAAYDTWYLQDGDELRPSAAEGLDALRTHMPELVPIYEAMVRDVGGQDPIAERMFTMWRPPAPRSHAPRPCSRWAGAGPGWSATTTIPPS